MKRLTLLALLACAAEARGGDIKLRPSFAIVGGGGYETIQAREGDDREDRGYSIALTRVGLKVDLGKFIYLESEFEVNQGPHGTSVWEGQAAIQVRNQLLRFSFGSGSLDLGHLTDESSIDYFSAHVADQLMTDPYTRNSLLASGFNRGLGALIRYEVVKGLKLGFTANWTNPTGTTASLVLGGTYPPFSRFYFAAQQQVGRDASRYPADQYDIIVLTPFITYEHEVVDAHASFQVFRADTNRSSGDDQPIDGYNVRLGARAKLFRSALRLWGNFSLVQNEVVDPNEGTKLSGEVFNGTTISGGVDYDYLGKSGVGVQYAMVVDQQGYATRTTSHYINVGTSYWLTDEVAIGARAAFLIHCEEANATSGCDEDGMRSYFGTVRAIF